MLHSNLWYDEQSVVKVARDSEGEGILYLYAIRAVVFLNPMPLC